MKKKTFFQKGYTLFSPTHLFAMSVCAGGLVYSSLRFQHMSGPRRKKMKQIVSLIPLGLESIQDGVLLLKHKMNADYLPLHLCGQAMFIEPLHFFMKEGKLKKHTGNMIYSLFLPGASMALVFPGWNNLPLFNGISLKKYAAHFCLVLYGMLIYQEGEVSIDKVTFWEDLAYLYGTALLLWPFNNRFNTNYLYTHAPVDPLRFIWNKYGKGTYIIVMMAAGLFLVSSMITIDRQIEKKAEHENLICH